ncbi:Glyoxalase domain-containing protein 4 [Eumeta japonica]|uniref:Glyoxalase domain-containing protein 4 n=1 Tax=Eumeta variegata TaxID=151549 RepID=A0A4C1VWX7_EUMVA|nr:Glyoxalase domain-containing protein 4 [Eumeta japonica]
MIAGRALHFVFKVADRSLTAKFYREILGMKGKQARCPQKVVGGHSHPWTLPTPKGHKGRDHHLGRNRMSNEVVWADGVE